MGRKKHKKYLEIGDRFGGWEVSGADEDKNEGRTFDKLYYIIKCPICGNTKSITRGYLISGAIKECDHIIKNKEGRTCIGPCGEFKLWEEFYKHPDGVMRFDSSCKECKHKYYIDNADIIIERARKYAEDNEDKIKEYRETNKEHSKEWHRLYYLENEERIKEQKKKYLEENKEKRKETNSNYRKKNRETINKKATEKRKSRTEEEKQKEREYYINNREILNKKSNERTKRRRLEDIEYRLTLNLRSRISRAINSQNGTKQNEFNVFLGCSSVECIQHLEATSEKGYKVKDIAPKGLNVDHIIPCAFFDLTDELSQMVCFNYRNLQLMWWEDNNDKSDDVTLDDEFLERFMTIMNAVVEGRGYEGISKGVVGEV